MKLMQYGHVDECYEVYFFSLALLPGSCSGGHNIVD